MADITRREFLKSTAAGAAASLLQSSGTHAADLKLPVEKGATLRVLRWKRFVQGDDDQFTINTKRFMDATGCQVRVDSENWEDLRPKAAVAANVGAGADIIFSTDEQAQLYPTKLLDVTDVADYLAAKYGGFYDVCRDYCVHEGKWIAIPIGAGGGAMVYRKSMLRAAGFEQFPKNTTDFLKLCKALKSKGTPPGFALGHATGDANGWTHWLMWSHGGKLVDANNNVTINSKETIAALEYAKELYQTFAPGVVSWLDPSNNKAFLAGEISLTLNGISIYYAAKTSEDPRLKAIAADIQHGDHPVGPIGTEAHGGLLFPAMIFKHCKYPNAAKEYLRFMMEKEQYEPWQAASIGYVSHTLKAYESNSVWKDPQHAYYRDVVKTMRHAGYAGKPGKASAATWADFVVVDMFAEVCTGQQSAKDAAARAEKKAMRNYRT